MPPSILEVAEQYSGFKTRTYKTADQDSGFKTRSYPTSTFLQNRLTFPDTSDPARIRLKSGSFAADSSLGRLCFRGQGGLAP